jgi:hypothetical protein
MKKVFSVLTDKERTPIIQKRIKVKTSGFRTKWGMYGTEKWFNSLKSDGLIQEIDGSISELLMTGHNDFPEFRIESELGEFQFERLGNNSFYVVGKRVKIKALKNMYINPTSGIENSLVPIIIEIEN